MTTRFKVFVGVVAVVSVALLGTLVGVVVGTRYDAGDGSDPFLSQPNAKVGGANTVELSPGELSRLAADRSAALADRDLDKFLADLDPTEPELRQRQTELFDNLQKVKLATATYKPLLQEGRAVDSFGRGVTISFDVAFQHQLDGYDPRPVEEWYRWTVRKKSRDARPVITEVTGAPADADPESKTLFYPAPWDRWPDMRVVSSPHVLLLVDEPQLTAARRYLPVAERAARFALDGWDASGVQGQVLRGFVISFVPDNKEMNALYQVRAIGPGDEAGHAMHMDDPASGDRRTASARIVIDLGTSFFRSGGDEEPENILRHEIAHAMVAPLSTASGGALWVVEGFAEYVAHRDVDGAGIKLDGARAALANGKRMRMEPLRFDALDDNEQINLDYFVGHQAYRYLVSQYGDKAAYAFVAAYYRTGDADGALRETVGVGLGEFQPAALDYAARQARS